MDVNQGAPAPAQVVALGAALLRQGKIIPSFAQFATTGDELLRIIVCGSVAGLTLNVHGRFLDAAQGDALPFNFAVAVTSDRSVAVTDFALGTGYILNLVAFTSGTPAPLVGQVFTAIQLINGSGGAVFVLAELMADYVTNNQPIGWPGSGIQRSTSGEPAIRTIVGTAPGVGIGSTETVPTNARWELISYAIDLMSAPGVGNFTPIMTIKDPSGNKISEQLSAVAGGVAVGLPARFYWTRGVSLQGAGAALVQTAWPFDMRLLAGSTVNLDPFVTMQWSAPVYTVREWLELS